MKTIYQRILAFLFIALFSSFVFAEILEPNSVDSSLGHSNTNRNQVVVSENKIGKNTDTRVQDEKSQNQDSQDSTNSFEKVAVIITIFSGIVALLALFLGPFVTFLIGKRQIISPMRQTWINELRELLSQFILISHNYQDNLSLKGEKSHYQELLTIHYRLVLMINRNEFRHRELIKKTKRITKLVTKSEMGRTTKIIRADIDMEPIRNKLTKHIKELIELSQDILKEEWEATKGCNVNIFGKLCKKFFG